MGTSASSKGPGSGVPFDPPWLDIICPQQSDNDLNIETSNQSSQASVTPNDLAPVARFQNARRNLSDFASTGNVDSFRKAVGHYSRSGMGGARNVARRMRTSSLVASNLFNTLVSVREGLNTEINKWIENLEQKKASVQEVVDEIIQRVAPSGGSIEETSCRDSMAQAMEDLIAYNPNIDLFHLTDDEIWFLIEAFLGYEAFTRLCLDIGRVFGKTSTNARARVERLNEMQDYLKAEIRAQIESLRPKRSISGLKSLQIVLEESLQNTFLVYEGAL